MGGMTTQSTATPILDAVDIEGFVAAQQVLAAATAASTAALMEGYYDVWCTTDVYLRVGDGANPETGLTASNGYLIRQNNTVTVKVRVGCKICAFSTPGGTLSYHKTG